MLYSLPEIISFLSYLYIFNIFFVTQLSTIPRWSLFSQNPCWPFFPNPSLEHVLFSHHFLQPQNKQTKITSCLKKETLNVFFFVPRSDKEYALCKHAMIDAADSKELTKPLFVTSFIILGQVREPCSFNRELVNFLFRFVFV